MRLPILRHHDNGGLERLKHIKYDTEEEVGIWIESSVHEQPGVQQHPGIKRYHCRDDEFPTAAERRDDVRGAVCEGESRRFLHIYIAGGAMTQQLIRMPQPVGKGGQHFQGDIRLLRIEERKCSRKS